MSGCVSRLPPVSLNRYSCNNVETGGFFGSSGFVYDMIILHTRGATPQGRRGALGCARSGTNVNGGPGSLWEA